MYGTLTLRELVVTGGRADLDDCDEPYSTCAGGAIWVDSTGEVYVSDCVFRNNTAYNGGAIAYWYGWVEITRSVFEHNVAAYDGGALHDLKYGDVIIDRTLFARNTAGYEGGVLYSNYGAVTCRQCNFTRNTADIRGGALSTRASGVPQGIGGR